MVAGAANALAGARSLVSGAFVSAVPCALVLEDNPVLNDGQLRFESFQGEIEEAYAVNPYEEIAQHRMSQPGFAVYRGGNWAAFSLNLIFRAGENLGQDIVTAGTADLEGLLISMERKVRWLQALAFPLDRDATPFLRRILPKGKQFERLSALAKVNEGGELRRFDPPFVFVVFGSFLTLRCYVTNVNIKWTGPWHPVSARPYGAEVQIVLQRLDRGYPNWLSVRNAAGRSPQTPSADRIPSIQGFVLVQ